MLHWPENNDTDDLLQAMATRRQPPMQPPNTRINPLNNIQIISPSGDTSTESTDSDVLLEPSDDDTAAFWGIEGRLALEKAKAE